MAWKGDVLAKPVIDRFGASYAVLTLPWQLTLDVDSGALKSSPLFGVGPNHFSQTYLTYKPIAVNSTYAWSAEFNYAFSLIATFVATQGVIGTIIWALFFIFCGILGVRMIRRLPSDPHARFIVVSSVSIATFLWLIAAISVPSHTLFLYALVATALGIGAGVKYGIIDGYTLAPRPATTGRKSYVVVMLVLVVAGAVWGVIYVKDAVALSYFGSGVKHLTGENDPAAADVSFAKAQSINASDIYLQARVEASISQANKLMSTITPTTAASTSQAIGEQVVALVQEAANHAQSAITHDPRNYYNYVSAARVSEFAAGLRMDKAYEQAVTAYSSAIQLNRLNPALYLSLARLHASQNKLDEALQAAGAAIQVKNNYLEAIYLLSQIEAAKGKLNNAIIAANVATQINPQSPILFFQLGLLHYNNRNYTAAATALEKAVELQSDYANAKYFLGLSYVRLNRVADAIEQFENLTETNPENQEVAFILNNLLEGKSPFADAQPPVTPTPEKRPTLPIQEETRR
jgi:tetratricopeptide (TPR) repeat protein